MNETRSARHETCHRVSWSRGELYGLLLQEATARGVVFANRGHVGLWFDESSRCDGPPKIEGVSLIARTTEEKEA